MVNELIAGMAQRLGLSLSSMTRVPAGWCSRTNTRSTSRSRKARRTASISSCTVGQAEAPTEAQLRTLLDANLFGQGTGEAALAYDPDMEEILPSAVSMRDMSISAN